MFCSCNNRSSSELHDGAVDFSSIPTMESCSHKYEVIDIDKAEILSESEFYNNYVSEMRFTKLSDSRPMKACERVCIDKTKVYALVDDKVYVFDKESGEYKFCVDYKGHGHNEYIRINDIQVIPQKQELLCISDTQRKLLRISTEDGSIKSVEKMLAGAPYFLEIGDYTYYQFADGTGYNENETCLLMKSDSINFLKKAIDLKPIQKMNYLAKGIYHHNNILTFAPVYSDTIYHVNINDDKIIPAYLIKDEHSIWQLNGKEFEPGEVYNYAIKNGYNYLCADCFFETKDYVFFTMVSNDKQRDYPITKEYLYNKKKHKTYMLDVKSYPGLSVQAPYPDIIASDNNCVHGLLSDIELINEYKRYNMISNKELFDIAKNIKDGDNPIFVTLKLK